MGLLTTPQPPLLVATAARTIREHAGPCAVCQWALAPGDRVADLADGCMIHVSCTSTAARTTRAT